MTVIARKFIVVVAGNTEDEYDDALRELGLQLNEGYEASTGPGFYFHSTSDVPDGELPR